MRSLKPGLTSKLNYPSNAPEVIGLTLTRLVKRLVALGHHEGDAARAVRASGEGRHSNKGVLTDRGKCMFYII